MKEFAENLYIAKRGTAIQSSIIFLLGSLCLPDSDLFGGVCDLIISLSSFGFSSYFFLAYFLNILLRQGTSFFSNKYIERAFPSIMKHSLRAYSFGRFRH